MVKAEAHARELQDLISLSEGNPRLAYKKALLVRLELQYSLALLRLDHGLEAPPQGPQGRTIDLERALVRLSSHVCEALRLYREKDNAGCLSGLYAADSLVSKIIPRLRRGKQG